MWLNQFGAFYHDYYQHNNIEEPYADSIFLSKEYVTELADSLKIQNIRNHTNFKGKLRNSYYFYEFVLYFFLVIFFGCFWWFARLKDERLGIILLTVFGYFILQSIFYVYNRNTSIPENISLLLLTMVILIEMVWPIKNKGKYIKFDKQ